METKQKPFGEVIEELEREIRSWQITVENKDNEIAQLKAELEAVASTVSPVGAVPTFNHVSQYKLDQLLEQGYAITGYAIEKSVEGAQPSRGFINSGGFVGWWSDKMQATPAAPAAVEVKALRIAEEALEVAIARIRKTYPGESIGVTREAQALVIVRAALSTQPAAVAVGERDAFEQDWMRRHHPMPMNTRVRDDSCYGDHTIQEQFEAFCAGHAALATTPEVPTDVDPWAIMDKLRIQHRREIHEVWMPLVEELHNAAYSKKAEVQAEPVAGQSRFQESEWTACSVEHVRMVMGDPRYAAEGYEARYLFTSPQSTQQDALLAALQRAHDWMDSQADSQSKGNHATFDILMLREERDAALAAIQAAQQGVSET